MNSVKKILLTLIGIIIVISYASCSKDHDAPTFSNYSVVKKPTNINATYSDTDNSFNVTWEMTNDTDVVDYYVTVSDSADFGKVKLTLPVGGTTTSYKLTADYVAANIDTLIQYFAVHAIYSNENLHLLIGPQSDSIDSALYVK